MSPSTAVARPKKITHVVQVQRTGEKIIVPEAITLSDAIEVLMRQQKYEDEWVQLDETIDAFIWDGGIAMSRVLEDRFGYVNGEKIPGGFFSPDKKPQMISVTVNANGDTIQVPWGRFSVPAFGKDAFFQTGVDWSDDVAKFRIHVTVQNKFLYIAKQVIDDVRNYCMNNSIYRGKAIEVSFLDNEGGVQEFVTPKFMDLSRTTEAQLILSNDVMTQVDTNLFTPILHTQRCLNHDVPIKRGVLLAGPFGTGKTLTAQVTAKLAQDTNHWTFLYIRSPKELRYAIAFARRYQPCVIFSEDVDKVITTERTDTVNELLELIDGIGSKTTQIITVLTTNHIDNINQAMFRPGRLDSVIHVGPPDADAVKKLIRYYGGKLIDPKDTLKGVSKELEGQIPAVIRECVERSKLYAISHNGKEEIIVTDNDLVNAARGMKMQLDLLRPKEVQEKNVGEQFIDTIAERVFDTLPRNLQKGRIKFEA